jgi:release factor glutamine methyltransferase
VITEVETSLGEALASLRRRLTAAGIANPALDARLLLLAATGLSHEALIAAPDRRLDGSEVRRLEAFAQRRLAREPVSRILAEREFYGRRFAIGPASLDPRPDTETLVERGLDFAGSRAAPPNILDLGTGSGAILVTLLAELPGASGTGTDISFAALDEARSNARRHGVADRANFVRANWCEGVSGAFDLIVSNPPYIPRRELSSLEREVRDYDPPSALDGGPDGLEPYRAMAGGAVELLAHDGLLALEIGAGQEDGVSAIFAGEGWTPASEGAACRDLAGRVRVLAFARPARFPA